MRTAIILLVLCAFACLGSATAIKKSHVRYNSTATAQVLTKDNYDASCIRIFFSDNTLRATCQTSNGDWKITSLDLNTCLSNTNGIFTCGGRYGQSARGQSLSGTTLSAQLQTVSGNWMQTTVNLNNFISNINGELVCDCYRNW